MSYKTESLLVFGIANLLGSPPDGLAHHGDATEFDTTSTITITGRVEATHFANPHAELWVADTSRGDRRMWRIQLDAPLKLLRWGVDEKSLRQGTAVVVRVYPAREPCAALCSGRAVPFERQTARTSGFRSLSYNLTGRQEDAGKDAIPVTTP